MAIYTAFLLMLNYPLLDILFTGFVVVAKHGVLNEETRRTKCLCITPLQPSLLLSTPHPVACEIVPPTLRASLSLQLNLSRSTLIYTSKHTCLLGDYKSNQVVNKVQPSHATLRFSAQSTFLMEGFFHAFLSASSLSSLGQCPTYRLYPCYQWYCL